MATATTTAATESTKQLTQYHERFAELQATVDKSNEVFKEYSARLEQMVAEREKLKGQNSALAAIVKQGQLRDAKVLEAHKATAKEVTTLRAQKAKLEMLCRTLQGERSQLHAKLGVGASSDDGMSWRALPTKVVRLMKLRKDDANLGISFVALM